MGTDNTWGGRSWRNLIAEALRVLGQDLSNTSVLELGFRDGSMSFAFASRGATVVGAEINAESVTQATMSAQRLSLPVTFMHYDGSPDNVPGRYDVVFTKSVLVLTDLAQILPAIDRKLNPGGRIVFIENGAGTPPVRLARYLFRSPRTYAGVRYFTQTHIDQIRSQFSDVRVTTSRLPPVYLIHGRKRLGWQAG